MIRRRRFAAPFVITAVLVPACTKARDEPAPAPRAGDARATGRQVTDAGAQVASADAASAAPVDAAVAVVQPTWAPDPQHPELLLPTPRYFATRDATTIVLERSLACTEQAEARCDPGVKCNPPAPVPVPCPWQLMPRLAPGARPTRVDGDTCWWEQIQVVCLDDDLPKAPRGALIYARVNRCFTLDDTQVECPAGGPTLELPAETRIGDIALRTDELACYESHAVDCPPGVGCNPPAPRQVECPPALMPKLINGAKPTRTEDGKCFWKKLQVQCS